jgi:hypothetical protein
LLGARIELRDRRGLPILERDLAHVSVHGHRDDRATVERAREHAVASKKVRLANGRKAGSERNMGPHRTVRERRRLEAQKHRSVERDRSCH